MVPEGFKPLTGVLRSKVADGKVRYRSGQSQVSRTGKSGITDLKVPYQFQKVRTQFDQSPVSDFKSPVSRRGLGKNAEGFRRNRGGVCVWGGSTGVYRVGAQVCVYQVDTDHHRPVRRAEMIKPPRTNAALLVYYERPVKVGVKPKGLSPPPSGTKNA